MGYVYFYYDTERKVCDYVGMTRSMARRTKEHRWYGKWVNENHVVGYVELDDKYMSAAEYVLINELKPTRNVMKKRVPKMLEGYSTNWDELMPFIKFWGKSYDLQSISVDCNEK